MDFVGYILPVEVNAKNSFGGYTGDEDWFCIYQYGSVTNCLSGSFRGNIMVHLVE